jgi:tetratricopeptide (TPR) repeat protein
MLEYRRGHMKRAHADLAHAAAAAPEEPVVAAWQAFLYVEDKQAEKAAAAEQRLMERLPFLFGVTGIRSDVANRDPPLLHQASLVWTMLNEELKQHLAVDGKAVPLLRLQALAGLAPSPPAGITWWFNAQRDFNRAATLAPEDPLSWKGLACVIWQNQWTPNEGLKACDAVLRLEPKAWEYQYLRGLFFTLDRHQVAALKAYTRALELHPDFAPALRERGAVHAELGQWAKAIADLTRAAELTGPLGVTPWDWLALAQLGRHDTAAYKRTCARMLTMFGRTPPPIWAGSAFAAGPLSPLGTALALHVAQRTASLRADAAAVTAVRCTTRPDAVADLQRLTSLTKRSSNEVRGKIFCRTGRYQAAVNLLRPLRRAPTEADDFLRGGFGLGRIPSPTAVLTLYLALAEHGCGRTAEAKRLLKETTVWLAQPAKEAPKQKNGDRLAWTERVQIAQLRHELETLLKSKAP